MPGLLRFVLIACLVSLASSRVNSQESEPVEKAEWSKYGKLERTDLKNANGERLYALMDGDKLITYVAVGKGKSLDQCVGSWVAVHGPTIVSSTDGLRYVLASHFAYPQGTAPVDSWIGRTVFVKDETVKWSRFDEKGKVVHAETVVEYSQPMRAVGEKNGWLLIENLNGTKGWIPKSDAVTLEDAVAYFTACIEKDIKNADALIRRANALVAKKEHDAALRDFDSALRLNPNDARVYRSRAELWRAKDDPVRRMADINEAIRLNPGDSCSFSLRGMAWLDVRNGEKAIADCTQALKVDSKNIHALMTRMAAWSITGDQAKMKADAAEVLRLDPSNSARSGLLLMIDDPTGALAEQNEAIKRNPGNPIDYLNRGAIWMQKKDYDKAIADYSEGLRLAPQFLPLYISRASAWIEKKEYDKAIADCSQALKLDPTFPGGYGTRGAAFFEKKDYARAILDFERAEKSSEPVDRGEAFANHATLLAASSDAKFRDGKKAIHLANQAIKALEESQLPGIDILGHAALAAAHAECGDFAEALRVQERAMQAPGAHDNPDMRARLELYRNRKPYRQP